jgi:hypothetical protein
MDYQIGDKKVWVFASQDCTAEGYSAIKGTGETWDAIVLEEKGNTKMVYHETFKSESECRKACEKVFKEKYSPSLWKGFFV